MTVWRLPLSYDRPPLTANQRLHWSHRSKVTAAICDEIVLRVRSMHIPRLAGRPRVTLYYFPPDNRRRDVDNLVPTSKACVDGLRYAGVLVDDDPAHVDHRMPVILPKQEKAGLTLMIVGAP